MTLLVSSSCLASANQLETAYSLALANDPQLQAADAQRNAALEAKPQARSLLLPQANLQANLTRTEFDRTDSGVDVTRNTQTRELEGDSTATGLQLTVTQALFDWSAFQQLRQSDEQVALAQARYLTTEQTLILRVAEAYFNAVAARDTVEFALAEKRSIERQLDQAQRRFEVGLSAMTDVQESQARSDLATADEIDAKRRLRSARETLREITGRYLDFLPSIEGELPLAEPVPASPDSWVGEALQSNLDLAAARLDAEISLVEIERRSGDHLPTLSFRANATLNDSEGDSVSRFSSGGMSTQPAPSADESESENYSFGLLLNWNAFTGLRNRSRVREAQAQFAQQSALVEQTKRAVERQTRDAYDGVLANMARVRALRQAVTSNQTALDASEAGFRVGNRTSVDVLNAQRELFRARRDLSRARYDYLLERLRLKQAVGQLVPSDLTEIDALLVSDASDG